MAVLLAASAIVRAQDFRIVCDDTCHEESPAAGIHYAVVNPAGCGTVEMIRQAPRLSTLSGKRIAVTGVSFMTGITHPQIKQLILEEFPDTQVFMYDEVGIAGPYPAPGVRRRQCEEFQARLRELKIDAVICGNGGCGLCTPKEAGSCIAAEMTGIPAVMIAGPGFAEQATVTAANNGIRVLRVARYPGAFASDSEETLMENTRNILWPQIKQGLTEPFSEKDDTLRASATFDPRSDVFYGTLEQVNEYFEQQDWSDGLPVMPPTFENVSEFLKYTPRKWDETVAVLPPAHRNTTVWHVAVNGAMAGCKPEYMPVLVAIAKGLGDPQFRRTLASTHAWMPYCWINGPAARQLGIDCGQGQINEKANIAIGRFINLALINLCGYYVKQDRMGTFGYPMPWCLCEDEDACRRIGWQPYHVRIGYAENESVVTLSSALLWGNNMAPSTTDPKMLAELLAWDISERGQFALGSGRQFTFRTILMTEPVAGILAGKFKSPAELEKFLVRESRRPLKERAFANYYANPGGRKDGGEHNLRQYTAHIGRSEQAEMTKTQLWYDSQEGTMKTVPAMKTGMTAFLVTGDSARNKVQTMPGGGMASVKLELPDNWEKLLKEAGYDIR